MIPKDFKEKNVLLGNEQPEYLSLPAFKKDSSQGDVITCWNLSFKERLRILFKGEIWLHVLTFNNSFPPIFLTTLKEDIFE